MKSPSVESFKQTISPSSSVKNFLSPHHRDRVKTSEAIYGLKGDLIALKDEINKLLTDEDRRRLLERQRKNSSSAVYPKYQRAQR